MADLSASSNDQLQEETRERLVEIERRLELLAHPRILRKVRKAHALLAEAERDLHAKGHVAALSGGIDK